MEVEQIAWPLQDAPALDQLIKHHCPTCQWQVPQKHVGYDFFIGRGNAVHQTIVINCEHCDARQVLPLLLENGRWVTGETAYVCVYSTFAAIFKLEREKHRGRSVTP